MKGKEMGRFNLHSLIDSLLTPVKGLVDGGKGNKCYRYHLTPILLLLLTFLLTNYAAAANNSCPGIFEGILSSFNTTESYDDELKKGTTDHRYHYVYVSEPGTISVKIESTNERTYQINVGSSCGADDYGSAKSSATKTITFQMLSAGTVYLSHDAASFVNNKLREFHVTITFIPIATGYPCSSPHPFELRKQTIVRGDLIAIGNSNVCADDDYDGICDSNQRTRNDTNNIIDINSSSSSEMAGEDSSLENVSTAELKLPPGAHIVWAGLYWQGEVWDINRNNTATKREGRDIENGDRGQERKALANTIKFRVPGGSLNDLTADEHYFVFLKRKWPNSGSNDYPYGGLTRYEEHYQSFKDVTSLLQSVENSLGSAEGNYTVANIQATPGKLHWPGVEAAWSLQVIYEYPKGRAKSLSVSDGYVGLYSNASEGDDYASAVGCPTGGENTGVYGRSIEFDITGFLTPKKPGFNTDMSIFITEADPGDATPNQEYLTVTDKNDTEKRIDGPAAWEYQIRNKNGSDNLDRTPAYIYPIGATIKNYRLSGVLDTEQISTRVKFHTGTDKLFIGVIGFSTKLREAEVCFDYTYGQNGTFITAPSIFTPKIEGIFDNDKPMEVKLYFENNVSDSDVQIKDLRVNIDDINITQVNYESNSTTIRTPGGTLKHIADTDLNISSDGSYLRDIPIGDFEDNSSAYVYYGLDLHRSDIDMPLYTSITYTLRVDINSSKTITLENLTTPLNKVNPCTKTFEYQPKYGTFNVIHPKYYKGPNEEYYYNLPTQVVGRVGNFKIQTMDANHTNSPADLNMSLAAVEMIDVAGFHYTTATCNDPNTTVVSTGRVWTITGTDSSQPSLSDLISKTEMRNNKFFNSAIANAAFRISYNMDDNGSPLSLTKLRNGRYKISNFPDYARGRQCQENFEPPIGSSMQVVTWCGNNGMGIGNNGMTSQDLKVCMECLYGLRTKLLCSRDNFSIRPESYAIALYDMNQSNPTQKRFITDNMSGTTSVDLAAGYTYIIDVNATDHNNTGPVHRYTTSNVDTRFVWSAPASYTCADTEDKNISVNFYNGHDDLNKSVSQVGIYTLSLIDNNWTAVDHRPSYMTHHDPGFFYSGADCAINMDTVAKESVWNALNGCIIRSQHTNTENHKNYTDLNVTYHPYKFDLSSFALVTHPVPGRSWIYMNDLNRSKEAAVGIEGNMTAKGFNDVTLSNYTAECMAQDLNLHLDTDSTPDPVLDASGATVPLQQTLYRYYSSASDLNYSVIIGAEHNITLPKWNFRTDLDQNGSAGVLLLLNLKKPYDETVNVADINFTIMYAYGINDISYADQIPNHRAEGIKTIGANKYFYFARVVPSAGTDGRQIYTPDTSTSTSLHVDVYCEEGGSIDCNTLPDLNSVPEDGNWYRVAEHDSTMGDGLVLELNASVSAVSIDGGGNSKQNIALDDNGSSTSITITYPLQPRPKHPVFTIIPDEWLKYDSNPDNDGIPRFILHFLTSGLKWKGTGQTGHVIETEPTTNSNKRLNW